MRQAGGFHSARPAVGLGTDCVVYHIDPSRSAKAAARLFGDALRGTILVCDRYSAYKKLVRDPGGLVTIQFCWSHVRRDFILGCSPQHRPAGLARSVLARFATLFRLHRECLDHPSGSQRRSARRTAA